ncbi:MAG: DUF4416 family protein [Hydrogenothermaceae bacterium]
MIFGLMWNERFEDRLISVESVLQEKYGRIIHSTENFTLPYSTYYQKEMGEGLIKKFIVLDCIIHKQDAVSIKKISMTLEDRFRLDGRTVNVDPVYLDEYQVVALSSKDRGSRIYISDRIYGEMELFYHHKTFHPFVWTYLDYRENIPFFNEVRKIYLKKVRDYEKIAGKNTKNS